MAAQADPISAMMAAGARTGGRQAVAVFRLADPALRVAAAVQIQVDPVVDGRPAMEAGTVIHVLAGLEAQVVEGATLAAREEDVPGCLAPRTTAMTVTAGVTAPDRTWRRYSTGL